ncbi:MAG: acetyltransferase [Acidimicrobiaceae bacterium]|nr:acetyltransferase [Acidimicrobiaceae bacterium]
MVEEHLRISPAETAADYEVFATFVREYLDSLDFAVDFQDTERELAELDHEDGAGNGLALIAYTESLPVGITGVRRSTEDICELKRMYVRRDQQGRGVGRALGERAIAEARGRGFRRMQLDTLGRMSAAVTLYRSLGFQDIAPYRYNPLADAIFLEREL